MALVIKQGGNMDWIFENLDKIGMILGALDIVFGGLPDKLCRWPGLILTIGHRLHEYGKDQRGLR